MKQALLTRRKLLQKTPRSIPRGLEKKLPKMVAKKNNKYC